MNNIKKFEQFFEKKANLDIKKASKKETKNEFVSIADKKKDFLKNRLKVEDKLQTKAE